ncbi:MAG TPA: hypothetical protein VID67_08615 [Rhizomicrobium sp.]
MQEDIVPATTALRDAIRICQSLIGAVADKARDPDQPTTYQTASATAAARLGASTAQLMSALARAADADTRQRMASFKMDEAIRRASPRRRAAQRTAEKEKPYDPHYYRDDPTDFRNYSGEDSEEENPDFNSAPAKSEGQNLNFNSRDTKSEAQKPDFNSGPRIRQL